MRIQLYNGFYGINKTVKMHKCFNDYFIDHENLTSTARAYYSATHVLTFSLY